MKTIYTFDAIISIEADSEEEAIFTILEQSVDGDMAVCLMEMGSLNTKADPGLVPQK